MNDLGILQDLNTIETIASSIEEYNKSGIMKIWNDHKYVGIQNGNISAVNSKSQRANIEDFLNQLKRKFESLDQFSECDGFTRSKEEKLRKNLEIIIASYGSGGEKNEIMDLFGKTLVEIHSHTDPAASVMESNR